MKFNQPGHHPVLPGGIRARLYWLIALALLPMLLLFVWISNQRFEARRLQALQTELEVARGVSTAFSAYLEGIHQQNNVVGQAILTSVSANPASEDARITHLLTVSANHFQAVRSVTWVSPRGIVLASSQPEMTGRDLSNFPYVQQVLNGQPWAIGDLTDDKITLGLACAIQDERGALLGVIVTGIEPARLSELALTQERPNRGAYSLFDSQGWLVYSSEGGHIPWEARKTWQESDPLLQHVLQTGQEQSGVASPGTTEGKWVSARVPVTGTGWVVGARRPVEAVLLPLERSLVNEIGVALIVCLLAFILASLLAQSIAYPLHRLERDSQAMGRGQVSHYHDPVAPNEVRRLRSTVETMAASLIQRANDLQESEEALRASESRFRISIETLMDGFAIFSAIRKPGAHGKPGKIIDFLYEYVNEAGCRINNRSLDEQMGRTLLDLLPAHKENGLFERYVQLVETGQSIIVESEDYEDVFGNGKRLRRTFELRAVKLGDGFVLTWRDISSRKRTEEQLQSYAGKLQRSNQDLEQFAMVASHDLQEPLRKIKMFGDSLAAELNGHLSEEGRDYLTRMQKSAGRMQTMIDGLLDLSRVTTRGRSFEPVILNQVVEDVVCDLEFRIQATGGQVQTGPLPTVVADQLQIRQLFQNLIGNALKFHKPDVPPLIRISGETHYSGKPPVINITVEDNGIGFDEQYAERIFQPFQRLHGRNEYEGTGLGLAICYKIVERHHGKIDVHSRPGEGSVFHIQLPLHPSQT